MGMKASVRSFLLRMAVTICALGALISLGAYTRGCFCVQMLLTPAFLLCARAAWQRESALCSRSAGAYADEPAAGAARRESAQRGGRDSEYFPLNSRRAS